MDGNSGLFIAFFILFIRDGLPQRHGFLGYQPASTGSNSHDSQGLGSSFGESHYNSQFGSSGISLQGGNRRVSDASSWNAGSSSKVEDNSRKISSSGSNNNKWNSGSAWNSGSQTGGYGTSVPSSNAGYQTSSSGFGNAQTGNSDWKNNRGSGGSSSGWNFGSEKEDRNPVGQGGKGQSSSDKEDNRRKTNANSGSKRPTGSSGNSGSDISFGFQNGDSKKVVGSDFGGSTDYSFGLDSKRPQGSGGSSSSSNWSSGNQDGDRKPNDFGGMGFSSSKDEKNQEKATQNGWNSGSSNNARRPEGNSGWSGSHSISNKPQGSSSSSSIGSSNWGSSSNSNSKRPEGISSSGNSNQGSNYDSKRPQGGGSSSGGNSDFSFNPASDSRRPQGSSSGDSSNWGSGVNSNKKKPQGGSSSGNSGSGFFSSKKPEDNQEKPNFNSERRPSSEPQKKQPDKTGGSESSNQKKTQQVDWDNLETENQQGSITFDFSELWHSNDRKDPAWRSIWTRNRFRRESDSSDKIGKFSPACECTDYPACPPENRVDVTKFLQHYHRDIRLRIVECASKRKICCVTSRSEEMARKSACGRRVSKLAEHDVSNDGSPNYGDYPWILRLVALGGNGEETLCSASLIHNSMALTTASCALLLTGKDVRVRSGEWNVVGGHDKNKMEETTIGKVYLHPDFDVVSYTKDLALLFFNSPFHLDRGANTVCLPTHHDSWDASKCVVVGWTRKNGSGLKSAGLKQVDLEIVAQGKCRRQEESKNFLTDFEDPGFVCSHSRRDDPNLGDVGASLLCPLRNSEAFVQAGFVSNPVPEKRNRKTATFTDVTDSLDWVYRMESIYTFVTGEDATE